VDDAVGAFDVHGGDGGVVDGDGVAVDADGDLGAVDGGDRCAVESEDVSGHDLAGDDVVGEDGGQGVGVGQEFFGGDAQGVEGGGEGFLGGGEHGEGSVALEGLDEAGSLHGGDQCREGAGFDGDGDDVSHLLHLFFLGFCRLLGGVRGRGSVVAVGAACGSDQAEAEQGGEETP